MKKLFYILLIIGLFVLIYQASPDEEITLGATTQETITDNADDAFDSTDGTGYADGVDMRLGSDYDNADKAIVAGFRFQTVAIPKDATINSATLTLNPNANNSEAILTNIYCEDADDAAAFADDGTNNPSDRTLTTAFVAWDVSAGWTEDTPVTTADFKACVAEVVARASWASGNDMVIIIKDDGSTAGNNRELDSKNEGSGNEAILDIDFTAAAGDSCTAPASGDWTVNLGDDCYVTTDTYIIGNLILIDNTGSGCLNIIDGATLSVTGWSHTTTRPYLCLEADDGSAFKTWTPI